MRRFFDRYTLAGAAVAFAILAWGDMPGVKAGGGYEAGVALAGQTVSIPLTPIQCGSGIICPFGVYRVTLLCKTTKAGSGKVSLDFGWSDLGFPQTANSGTCQLNALGSSTGISFPLYLDGTANPTYKATVNPGPGAATWRANIVLERLQ